MSEYYIYILANKRNGTLYVGMTNDLARRVYEHKNDFVQGFTKKYGVHCLVYYEQCDDFDSALQREKQIKEWKRAWKLELIEKVNPLWKDLFEEIIYGC
jgi:putative endonuclease